MNRLFRISISVHRNSQKKKKKQLSNKNLHKEGGIDSFTFSSDLLLHVIRLPVSNLETNG